MSIRTTVPCALNVCPPFHGISSTGAFNDKPQTILASARNVLEDETRRNTFWVGMSCSGLLRVQRADGAS